MEQAGDLPLYSQQGERAKYNEKNFLALRFPAVITGGSLQYILSDVRFLVPENLIAGEISGQGLK